MLAYWMRASSAEALGASALSSLAAAGPGVATITASASMISGRGTGPVTSRQPVSVLCSSRTVTPVLTSASDALATASGREPMPFRSDVKTGPASLGASSTSCLAAVSSERSERATAATRGIVASSESMSARPA